eukprot:21515-Heterococcus_DN1.PRE.1
MEDSTVLKPVVKPVQPAAGANGAPAHAAAAIQPIEEDSAEEQEEQPEGTQKIHKACSLYTMQHVRGRNMCQPQHNELHNTL